MSSWDLIGWVIIGTVVLGLGLAILGGVGRGMMIVWRHLRTRDVPPAVGQRWERRDGYTLYVHWIYENGRIGVTTKPFGYNPAMYASWGEEPEAFADRTREGLWRLVEQDARPKPLA